MCAATAIEAPGGERLEVLRRRGARSLAVEPRPQHGAGGGREDEEPDGDRQGGVRDVVRRRRSCRALAAGARRRRGAAAAGGAASAAAASAEAAAASVTAAAAAAAPTTLAVGIEAAAAVRVGVGRQRTGCGAGWIALDRGCGRRGGRAPSAPPRRGGASGPAAGERGTPRWRRRPRGGGRCGGPPRSPRLGWCCPWSQGARRTKTRGRGAREVSKRAVKRASNGLALRRPGTARTPTGAAAAAPRRPRHACAPRTPRSGPA